MRFVFETKNLIGIRIRHNKYKTIKCAGKEPLTGGMVLHGMKWRVLDCAWREIKTNNQNQS